MAVMSINPNDFLTTKKEGEFVTAEEWNRLVALFTVLNNNAMELLSTNQAVDSNKANILHLTAGAVPDESITCEKLSTKYTLKNTYIVTQDTTPVTGKTYYTYENGIYTAVDSLSTFEADIVYYELTTEYAKPAINTPEIIGDKVITGDKIANETLKDTHCMPNILGMLLKDCTIDTYSQAVTVPALEETTVTFTLKKAYGTVVLLNSDSLLLVRAGDKKVLGISAELYGNLSGVSNYLGAFSVKYDTPDTFAKRVSYEKGQATISFMDLGDVYLNLTDITLSDNKLTITLQNLQRVEVSETVSTTVIGL